MKLQIKIPIFFTFVLLINCKNILSQTDNCGAGATLLTPGSSCSYVTGSTVSGFTDSNQGCATGDEDDDGWYRFVATASTHTVTLVGASGDDFVLGTFNTCGGGATDRWRLC